MTHVLNQSRPSRDYQIFITVVKPAQTNFLTPRAACLFISKGEVRPQPLVTTIEMKLKHLKKQQN